MKKIVLGINLILIALILIGDLCYMEFGGLEIKTPTSIGFVLLGVVNLVYALKSGVRDHGFHVLLLAGLTLAMLGDVLINIEFMAGAALFAVAHVFYFVSYCRLSRLRGRDFIPGGMIFAASLAVLLLTPGLEFGGVPMKMLCIIYALLISLMVGKAVANLIRNHDVLHLVLVIGSVLFFFSDLMLLFDVFADVPHIFDTLCLISYYPAQCLLGFSAFLATEPKRKAA